MKICVIGAGVIGLSSALRILETFPEVEVSIFADRFSPNTTGDGAAGLWLPYALGDTPEDTCLKWAASTFHHLLSISKSEDAYKAGVELVSGYKFLPKYTVAPFWKDVCLGFRKVTQREIDLFAPHAKDGWFFTSIYCSCRKYLPWLTEKLQRKGCTIVQRKIESFDELANYYDVIINCTGLGAYFLVNDKSLSPCQGHLVTVKDAPGKHFWIDTSSSGHTSIHPREDMVIVGGTKFVGEWGNISSLSMQEGMLRRAHKFVPSLKNGTVVESWTGLRPVRSKGVRLEREVITVRSRKVQVVHNYGHGGSGITLHWGCAGDVVNLVGKCKRDMLCSKL